MAIPSSIPSNDTGCRGAATVTCGRRRHGGGATASEQRARAGGGKAQRHSEACTRDPMVETLTVAPSLSSQPVDPLAPVAPAVVSGNRM